jgi:hypothetical protein
MRMSTVAAERDEAKYGDLDDEVQGTLPACGLGSTAAGGGRPHPDPQQESSARGGKMNQAKSTARLGYWLSWINVVFGALYLGLAMFLLAVPEGFLFGTNAIAVVILVFAPWLVLEWAVIHHVASKEKRAFTLGSLVFIAILTVLTSINRYNALTVVPHATAMGKTDGLDWFQPYGAPSVMMSIEILGWGWFYGLACLCLAPAFGSDRLERAISWVLVASGVISIGSVIGPILNNMFLNFIGIPAWGPGFMLLHILLARWFKRQELA